MEDSHRDTIKPSDVCIGFDLGIQCVGCCWPCWEELKGLLGMSSERYPSGRIQKNREIFYDTLEFSTNFLIEVLEDGTIDSILKEIGDYIGTNFNLCNISTEINFILLHT